MIRKRVVITHGDCPYLRTKLSMVVKWGLSLALIIAIVICAPSVHAAGSAAAFLPQYNLSVSFDVDASKIYGRAEIHAKAGSELIIHTDNLKIIEATVEGKKADFTGDEHKIALEKDGIVQIIYEAEFKSSDDNIISKKGIALRGLWYPLLEGMSVYSLKAALPDGHVAISEAEKITMDKRGDTAHFAFDFPYPLNDEDGISLIASKNFVVSKDTYNGIEIAAYLLPEEAHFAKTFIEHTKRYLKTYEKLLGKYPYKRLSIVEHFQQAGYSMPTYIFLGREDFKLPIEKTPLGHEIVHQWFGNYVYTDYDRGNWNEGLTIYFADHSYDDIKGTGWKCRRRILSGYKSHVKDKKEFPLSEFSVRYDLASRSIGYGKAAMVVHMLRKEAGDRLFYASIKDFIRSNKFKVASWDDLKKSFEKNTSRDLSWFFNQWIDKKGTPELSMDNINISRLQKQFSINFNLIQKNTDFRLSVPVSFYSKGKKTTKIFTLDKSRESFNIILPQRPDEIVIDEDYDLFRTLAYEEDPPTLERLASDEKKLVVLPPKQKGMYAEIVDVFNEKGKDIELAYMKSGIAPRKYYTENTEGRKFRFSMKNTDKEKRFFSREMTEISDEAMKASSIVVLGADNPVIEKLFGKTKSPGDSVSPLRVDIKKNPLNPEKVVAIVDVAKRQDTSSGLEQIFEYPFYSSYSVKDGQVTKKLQEMPRGLRFKVDLQEAQ
jgi:aminopeptidase N